MSSLIQSNTRPLSTSLKKIRYQVCPTKRSTYHVISKITPQLLEQIQKKSLGAGGLQPGRLPQLFNSHPLNLPLVPAYSQSDSIFNKRTCLPLVTESKLYFSTSTACFKKQKKDKKRKRGKKMKNECKKDKKKKKGEKKNCKLAPDQTGGCANIKLNNCAPTTSKLCTRDSVWPPCHKKCAPYPSYSESCHEDKPLPPSECRICPWSKEEHPTFVEKPRIRKSYHTSCQNISITDTPFGVAMKIPGSQNINTTPTLDVPTSSVYIPFIDQLPSAEILCNKCSKEEGGEDSCGQKVKSCKKDKKNKKKKHEKKDKCKKKSKKDKKKKKKKSKKRKCNPQWKHPPCKKREKEHSQICPTDLIKKPKCP